MCCTFFKPLFALISQNSHLSYYCIRLLLELFRIWMLETIGGSDGEMTSTSVESS